MISILPGEPVVCCNWYAGHKLRRARNPGEHGLSNFHRLAQSKNVLAAAPGRDPGALVLRVVRGAHAPRVLAKPSRVRGLFDHGLKGKKGSRVWRWQGKFRFGVTPKPDTRDACATRTEKFRQRNLVAKNELVYRNT